MAGISREEYEANFEKNAEALGLGLHQVLCALQELGWPYVIAVQNRPMSEAINGFPGIIAYDVNNAQTGFMAASLFLKEGFVEGMRALGFPVQEMEKDMGDRKFAELEQSDATGKCREFPSQYTNMGKDL